MIMNANTGLSKSPLMSKCCGWPTSPEEGWRCRKCGDNNGVECDRCQGTGLITVRRWFEAVGNDGTVNEVDAEFASCPECNR